MHQHRWATVKRWKLGPKYFIIQHCRRVGCDEWIRREISLNDEKLGMQVKPIMQEWKDHNAA
jgi:hypothetical protein